MAGPLGRRGCVHGPEPRPLGGRRRPLDLRPRDAPVPLRRAPHGARLQLHARRRLRARPAPAGVHGAAPDGVRRVRPERRERRDPGRRPPARDHEPQHRGDPPPDEAHGVGDRLVARGLDRRARVLPLDAVAVPALLRARARLSARGAGQVVSEGPDGARERAGDRRPLRAVRHRGRGAEPDAVVLQDHRLRRPAARRDGAARVLARARADDAAELDRPLGGRARHVHGRRERRGAAGLHDAARHVVRRHLLRPRPGAPDDPPADRGLGARAGGRRLRAPHGCALRGRAGDEGEGRRLHRPLSRSTRSTASPSRSGSPTTS